MDIFQCVADMHVCMVCVCVCLSDFIGTVSFPGWLAVRATVNILDWKLVLGSGAFSRMFAAANC